MEKTVFYMERLFVPGVLLTLLKLQAKRCWLQTLKQSVSYPQSNNKLHI